VNTYELTIRIECIKCLFTIDASSPTEAVNTLNSVMNTDYNESYFNIKLIGETP